jgi:hypothetical protein
VFVGEFCDENMCAMFECCQGLAGNFPINRLECLLRPVVAEDKSVS